MALPTDPVVTAADVALWLGLPVPTEGDDPDQLIELAAAVDEIIRALPSTVLFCDGDTDWPARWVRGAKMWAGRLQRRRMSPEGVYTLGAGDVVAYVNRNDPDVASLLRLNLPMVG